MQTLCYEWLGALCAGLFVTGVLGPVLLELGFADLEILHHVGVMEQDVVA
jgi:hypothetical protein